MKSTMRVFAPAKINVYLRIIGRRPDGYHLLDSLMVPVSLYDIIEIEAEKGAPEITVTCDDPSIPCDKTNLVYKAAALLCEETGIQAKIAIDLRKNIPAGAGLGGGSSDAAVVLKSLNILLSLGLTEAQLCTLAARLGADVPFFIPCQPARVGGIGEVLTMVPPLPALPIVIVVPPFGVATPWAYRRFDEFPASEPEHLSFPEFIVGQWPPPELLVNDLERAVVPEYPLIAQIKSLLCDLGAIGALMSGSGSAVFGLFRHRTAAEQAVALIKDTRKTFLVEALSSPSLIF